MTHDNSQTEIATTLSAICNPLSKKLRKMRRTIEGWTDDEIRTALFIVEKHSPLAPEDTDFCEAEHILRKALDRENAKRIARNAPWLTVFVAAPREGGGVLTVSHDVGNALTREFGTFEQAKAAGDAVQEFLTLLGRDCDFTYRHAPPKPCDPDTSDIPF